jgi:release factor glutamine methyltransferase
MRRKFAVECLTQGQRIRLRIRADRVFVPNLIGLFRSTQLRVVPGETVCDVGTGSGFHAILAAKLGAGMVYGVDLNPAAIADARANARLNGVADRCRFFVGSLVEPLRRRRVRADLVMSTLPNWRSGLIGADPLMRRSQSMARHFDSGRRGMDLTVRLIREARGVLAPGGRLELHLVDWAAPAEGRRALAQRGFRVREVARAGIPDWGRYNNLMSWLARQRLPLKRRLDFGRFPSPRGLVARIIEAKLGEMPPPSSRRPRRLDVRWGRIDPALKRVLAAAEETR